MLTRYIWIAVLAAVMMCGVLTCFADLPQADSEFPTQSELTAVATPSSDPKNHNANTVTKGPIPQPPPQNPPPEETTKKKETDPKKDLSDPIRVTTGAVVREEKDIFIPCPLISIDFRRSYNSLLTYSGPLGYNWAHTYDIRLWSATNTAYNNFTGNWVIMTMAADVMQDESTSSSLWFRKTGDNIYEGTSGYTLESVEGDIMLTTR